MMKAFLKRTRKRDGFTLIELIVVVAILGILAAVVTPRVLDAIDNAKKNSALAFGKEIQLAMERVYLKDGEYPLQDTIQVATAADRITNLVGLLDDYTTINAANITSVSYTSTADDDYTLVIELKDSNRTITIEPGSVEDTTP